MKKIWLFFVPGVLSAMAAFCQDTAAQVEGTVSYITSQSVYVKFSSTKGISAGDTLYVITDGVQVPALRVKNLSSISCVCEPLITRKFNLSDQLFTKRQKEAVDQEARAAADKDQILPDEPAKKPGKDSLTLAPAPAPLPERKELVTGRISAATYFNISDTPSGNSFRMRYNLLLNARNIGNSRLSAESYINFSHKEGQWSEIRENVFDGLKIYNLSMSYHIGKNARITAGRKINPKISNMGAVDGIQFEIKTGSFTTGVLAGSRPDYNDYGFNTSLFQYGAFINHERAFSAGNIQSTLAFIEQKNTGITDRRFTYFQHSNTLVRNLSFFGSAEFDLYRYNLRIDSSSMGSDTMRVTSSSPKLSNLYLSMRYRFSGKLSVSLSYSSRQNIIYYETYKNFIDQLLERETQQGYLLQATYRPLKKLSLGANGGYRVRKNDPNPSKNLYTYITYSQVPFIGIAVTLSTTLLSTSYLEGSIYGLNISRDIVKGKLSGAFTYRFIDYFYSNSHANLMQHTGEINLNWKIRKKLACTFYYEGSFDSRYVANRFYVQLSRSF